MDEWMDGYLYRQTANFPRTEIIVLSGVSQHKTFYGLGKQSWTCVFE